MATTEMNQPESSSPEARIWRVLGAVSKMWNRFWRLVALYMPKRLYARSLLIIITPMILLQSVVTLVFMERHWQTVTQRLSTATTRDIAAIIDMIETYPQDDDYANVIRIAQDRLSMKIDILPPDPLPPPGPKPFFSILDQILSAEITRQINRPVLDRHGRQFRHLEVRIQLEGKVLRAFARRSQAYASNTHIFLIWMVGTSLVLLMIAIPFLRNQIRPILNLAEAAESFGKGRPMPRDFRPRGAEEVRRAGFAFIQMRERIERQIEQRTAMLTGVSHDLRTILTRFKLQLALSGSKIDTRSARPGHQRHAVDAGGLSRLRARRGRRGPRPFRPGSLFRPAARGSAAEKTQVDDGAWTAIRRSMCARTPLPASSTTSSAIRLRYAKNVRVQATHTRGSLTVIVDDDGPGIPAG